MNIFVDSQRRFLHNCSAAKKATACWCSAADEGMTSYRPSCVLSFKGISGFILKFPTYRTSKAKKASSEIARLPRPLRRDGRVAKGIILLLGHVTSGTAEPSTQTNATANSRVLHPVGFLSQPKGGTPMLLLPCLQIPLAALPPSVRWSQRGDLRTSLAP